MSLEGAWGSTLAQYLTKAAGFADIFRATKPENRTHFLKELGLAALAARTSTNIVGSSDSDINAVRLTPGEAIIQFLIGYKSLAHWWLQLPERSRRKITNNLTVLLEFDRPEAEKTAQWQYYVKSKKNKNWQVFIHPTLKPDEKQDDNADQPQ